MNSAFFVHPSCWILLFVSEDCIQTAPESLWKWRYPATLYGLVRRHQCHERKLGVIVPNDLSNGIRAIEISDISGTQLSLNTRNNGKWEAHKPFQPMEVPSITINAENTLPIKLSAFSGKSSATGIQLQWQTAQEINNNYFELLHADDNQVFKPVAKINGAINTTLFLYWLSACNRG